MTTHHICYAYVYIQDESVSTLPKTSYKINKIHHITTAYSTLCGFLMGPVLEICIHD